MKTLCVLKKALLFLLPLGCAALWADSRYGRMADFDIIPESDGSLCLEIAKGYLFSGCKKHLTVYDIKEPSKPKKAAVLENIGETRQMVHKGNYLYISQRAAGILIIDITNPAKPEKAGFYDTAEFATGLSIAGNLLFCAQRIFGVEIIDISNPVKLRTVALQRTYEAQSCTYRNGYIYVGDWEDAFLTVIDAKNPALPRIVSEHKLDGYGDGVFTDDKYCYAATGHHKQSGDVSKRHGRGHGLEIYSLANPAKPEFVSRVDFPQLYTLGNDFWSVKVCGDTAVVADTHNGVFVVDVRDRKNPVIKQRAVFPPAKGSKTKISACCADIELGNKVIYASIKGVGVSVIPCNDVTFVKPESDFTVNTSAAAKLPVPGWKRYDLGSSVRRVAVRNNFAYAAASMGGLKVVDLESGRTVQSFSLACAYDVTIRGSKLYCAAGTDGIVTYLINCDGTLSELSRTVKFIRPTTKEEFTPSPKVILAPSTGNTLVWSDRGSWVCISKADNPAEIINRARWIRLIYGDPLPDDDINGILPVHFCNFGTVWFDLKDGKAVELSRDDSMKDVSGRAKGGLMEAWSVFDGEFFAPSQSGYTLLDPAVCGKNFKTYKMPGIGGSATVCGKYIAITDRHAGTVKLFDFTDIAKPVEIKGFSLKIPGTPERAKFWKGHLVVPAGLDGLLVSECSVPHSGKTVR